MAIYKGFSSAAGKIDTRLTDVELIKADLANSLNIRRGEVRGRPRLGTRIFDMIGQPLNNYTRAIVEEDVRAAIGFDPRVQIRKMEIDSSVDSITVRALLYYVELDIEDLFEFYVGNTS